MPAYLDLKPCIVDSPYAGCAGMYICCYRVPQSERLRRRRDIWHMPKVAPLTIARICIVLPYNGAMALILIIYMYALMSRMCRAAFPRRAELGTCLASV